MALDTRNRRASALGVGLASLRSWPAPDASLANRADREHLAYLYRLTADAVAGPVFHLDRLDRLHFIPTRKRKDVTVRCPLTGPRVRAGRCVVTAENRALQAVAEALGRPVELPVVVRELPGQVVPRRQPQSVTVSLPPVKLGFPLTLEGFVALAEEEWILNDCELEGLPEWCRYLI